MGNQLTGIAPSQILPIEQYLTDIPEHEFDTSLGSTRFFKVARSKNYEGFCVVKVFVIHDPSLPLQEHQDKLKDIGVRLEGTSNCLPFRNAIQTDRAALLFRQYLKDSLYDRISTRPFLNAIEKKWIAFQLLCALNQCHKLKVCHGDIKSENVMITSWNWLLLTDFASFKPTYLPEDNPSDFNYFFDTSRRRTCFIAPERFVESNSDSQTKTTDITAYGQLLDLTTGHMKTGDLTPTMDIFSVGCVLTELFTEGTPPFDLSQLLAYRNGEYSPWKILEHIDDTHIRELIRHMLQKDPACRLSAEDYLIQQRGRAFPEQFYTFLKLYLQRYATIPITPPDDRIMRLSKDLSHILYSLNADVAHPDQNVCLIIIITFVTGCVRSLQYCSTKLTTLELLLRLAKYVTSDVILDRILPFVLHFVNDGFARVRAEALRTVTNCLSHLSAVPKSDATVFPEYILPQLSHLTQDPAPMVRVTYAENITQLAETALRVLEMTQLQGDTPEMTGLTEPGQADSTLSYQALHYDVELQTLQELVQQKVVTLLSDPDNSVKQTLMEHGITRLCGFFGRQKANDVLLSHMITFLNDKNDWQLRGSFFDNIIGVASYVGWPSATILKPLLQQGLGDSEEYVVQKALCALSSLTQLSLIQKPLLYDFVRDVVPLLSHPGAWIRQGAVGFLAAVARVLNIADVHCRLLPQVQPFLKHTVLQLDKEVVLLGALRDPVPRQIYDYVLRSNAAESLFSVLKERSHMRQITRHGHRPVYPEMDDTMTQLLRKLTSQGLQEQHEDKLLALKDFMMKIHRVRSGTGDSLGSDREDNQSAGSLNLVLLGKSITRRHADMAKPSKDVNMTASIRKKKGDVRADSPSIAMNAEWKSMFSSGDLSRSSLTLSPKSSMRLSHVHSSPAALVDLNTGVAVTNSSSVFTPANSTYSMPSGGGSPDGSGPAVGTVVSSGLPTSGISSLDKQSMITRYAACKLELRDLVYKRRDQHTADVQNKDQLDGICWESRPPPASWKPRGLLVAHTHEHRAAVNRVKVSSDHTYFASCSDDGTVKIWDSSRLEGKSVANRSRLTYKQGGRIRCIEFLGSSHNLASSSDTGSIQIIRIDTGNKMSVLKTHETGDAVVDMAHFETGIQSILAYATVNGYLMGWDLRSPDPAWKLKNDPKIGLLTCFAVHPAQYWLTVGTSSGKHVCWDLRVQLPITTITHATGARVRRLSPHPREQSWLISAVQGNNEVSMWDLESGARQTTLWASTAPALSQTQASCHSVYGMYVASTDSKMFLLTAGSDMRLRYWDLAQPTNSFIVAGASSDPRDHTAVSYRLQVTDGTEVIQETYGRTTGSQPADDIPRRSHDTPAKGHHDVISDVSLCQASNQCFVITASRDGVVKVWK